MVVRSIEKIDYKGWTNTYRLSNGLVEVCVLSDIGPRIIDFRLTGGENIFHVREAEAGGSGEREWKIRGGWRLWVAPEKTETTYLPDNEPCIVEQLGRNRIRVVGQPQRRAGIRKTIEVTLPADESRVRITSRITNVSQRTLNYAGWTLSAVRPGGRALVPMDKGDRALLNDLRTINFWSYTDPQDRRYSVGDELFVIDQRKIKSSRKQARPGGSGDEGKVGVDTKQGWVAYHIDGLLYMKRFGHKSGQTYPDNGSTVEIYSCREFLECENLGPFVTLKPGDEIVYPEDWWLFQGVRMGESETAILKTVTRYLAKTNTIR